MSDLPVCVRVREYVSMHLVMYTTERAFDGVPATVSGGITANHWRPACVKTTALLHLLVQTTDHKNVSSENVIRSIMFVNYVMRDCTNLSCIIRWAGVLVLSLMNSPHRRYPLHWNVSFLLILRNSPSPPPSVHPFSQNSSSSVLTK